MIQKEKILFLCTGNSCRSQMAEGFARKYLSDRFDVYSAGIEAHGLNRYAVRAMDKVGIDISGHQSKTSASLGDMEFDYVITVCGHAKENCPYFPAKVKVIHHGFEDPPKLAEMETTEEGRLVHYARVRDEIENFIQGLQRRYFLEN